MADATVKCDTSGNLDDGFTGSYGADSNIAAVRDATTGNISNQTSATSSIIGHGTAFGGNVYVYRPFANFDLSGNDSSGSSLSGNTVESAQIKFTTEANLTGFSNVTSQGETIYLCKTDGFGSSLSTADYNALDGWVSSGSYNGEVTVYGTATDAASSEITFNLSSEAITDINSAISAGEDWTIMFLCQDDFLYTTGTGGLGSPVTTGGFARFDGVRMKTTEVSGTDCNFLHLTYGSASPLENSILFGTNF